MGPALSILTNFLVDLLVRTPKFENHWSTAFLHLVPREGFNNNGKKIVWINQAGYGRRK